MNRKITIAVLGLILTVSLPAEAATGKFFGYAGLSKPNIQQVEQQGIKTTVDLIDWPEAGDIPYFNNHGIKPMIILDTLLFTQNGATASSSCGIYTTRKRLDYQTRFNNWYNQYKASIAPSKIYGLVINTEVNNRCITNADLNELGLYVKSKAPGIPTIDGYGQSQGARPLPSSIPAGIDIPAMFQYNAIDPATDAEYQGQLAAFRKLAGSRKIIIVPRGYVFQGENFPRWKVGVVDYNFAKYFANDSQVAGVLIFLWHAGGGGLIGINEMQQSVKDYQKKAAALVLGIPLKTSLNNSFFCRFAAGTNFIFGTHETCGED